MEDEVNLDLKRMGINLPKIIRPQEISQFPSTGMPKKYNEFQEEAKVYRKQKWFRTYNSMIQWRSQNGISDFVMVQMKRPYRGYRFQLHYNSPTVTNKSKGIVQ